MVNLFGRCILLFAFAYAGGDPPPNQIVLLDNTEHTRNGIANTFSVRETHTTHECKMRPSFEDFITKIFNLVRRHIPPCAWGALLCSWLLPVFELDTTSSCSNTDGKVYWYNFFIRYENIGYHNCFPVYEKNISAFCCRCFP